MAAFNGDPKEFGTYTLNIDSTTTTSSSAVGTYRIITNGTTVTAGTAYENKTTGITTHAPDRALLGNNMRKTIESAPPVKEIVYDKYARITVPVVTDKFREDMIKAWTNLVGIPKTQGLTALECLIRYEITLKEQEIGNWPFRIMKNAAGERYIGLVLEKKGDESTNTFYQRIRGFEHLYSLTVDQFKVAQDEWSRLVKLKAKKEADKDKLQVVVDNSIPGDYEW